MSKLDEVLERTRAEEPEGEPEPDAPEPDESEEAEEAEEAEPPTPEPPAGVDEKALERELSRHAKQLQKVLGAGWADMEPCAACFTMGYVAIDAPPLPEPREDPDLVACPDCNAYGDRLTPSLKENYRTVPCGTCNGTGYRSREQLAALAQAEAWKQPPAPVAPPPAPAWDASRGVWVDQYGSPLGPASANGPGALSYATGQ